MSTQEMVTEREQRGCSQDIVQLQHETLSKCEMEGFQPLSGFTVILDSTGVQNLGIFVPFALDGLN